MNNLYCQCTKTSASLNTQSQNFYFGVCDEMESRRQMQFLNSYGWSATCASRDLDKPSAFMEAPNVSGDAGRANIESKAGPVRSPLGKSCWKRTVCFQSPTKFTAVVSMIFKIQGQGHKGRKDADFLPLPIGSSDGEGEWNILEAPFYFHGYS